MQKKLIGCFVLLAASCGGGSGTNDAGIDQMLLPDAPQNAPILTSFYPTPASVPAGTPTTITWNWTYAVDPVIPPPVCTIDNGIGQIANGGTTTVTLTQTTQYRLTCANVAGMTARDTVIAIPPAAPALATFTATPSPLMPNAATPVTFTWTFSNTPSPPPTCTIDAGIGAATSGMTVSLTLAQARTFRLRCTNQQGSVFRDVTVGVNECAGGTAQCGANATCTDTIDSYTCACNAGYSGNGDVCSTVTGNCTTPGVCSSNATCSGTTTCVCNAGYVGDGLTCNRQRIQFVTSAFGTGNLATWANATGTGLVAADSVCNFYALQAGLPGTYVAWMSDATDDAYCRVHQLGGKKAGNCGGLATLPATAGPWVRSDTARTPAAPMIDSWLAPTRQTLYPVTFSQTGSDLTTAPQTIWTGTDDTGVYTGNACSNWTSADGTGTFRGSMGDLSGGGTAWTDQGADLTCNSSGRLRCVEVAVGSGPALPPRHPIGKKAFVTSVSGTGMLSSWADAQSLTGISAADAICQARARYAGFANSTAYKAWAVPSFTSITSRIFYDGARYRPDGVLISTSRSDMTDGRFASPLYQTELGTYASGNADIGSVWTGMYYYGSYYSSFQCNSWTATTSYSGVVGRFDLMDYRAIAIGTSSSSPSPQACTATDYRLYCVEDSP